MNYSKYIRICGVEIQLYNTPVEYLYLLMMSSSNDNMLPCDDNMSSCNDNMLPCNNN